MKKAIAIISILLVSFNIGCGPIHRYKRYKKNNLAPQSKYVKKVEIDSAMVTLFEEWLIDCYKYELEPNLANIKYMKFTDTLSGDYAGLSTKEGILIQKDYEGKEECKVLFYHEMAHCSFRVGHDTINTGIMSPYFIPIAGKIYLSRWEYYLDGYFKFIRENKI